MQAPDGAQASSGAMPVDPDNDRTLEKGDGSVGSGTDGTADSLDLDSDNACAVDRSAPLGARVNANAPSSYPDANCPASAPMCDTTVGRCVVPEGAYTSAQAVLHGAGASSLGCSSTGDAGGLMALMAALGLALRGRRRT
jgi:uncharacterized protein (TIGR03382 family)